MEQFVSQDPRSYSLYFDLNIWFRARKVTGTFEKRAPGASTIAKLMRVNFFAKTKTNKGNMPMSRWKTIEIFKTVRF